MKKKLALLVVFLAGVGLFYYFDLGQYFNLESLKENKERLDSYYRQNTAAMIIGFIGVYIAVVALSLP